MRVFHPAIELSTAPTNDDEAVFFGLAIRFVAEPARYAPFIDSSMRHNGRPRTRARKMMSAVAAVKSYVLDQVTPVVVTAKLGVMAAMLNYRPSQRHHLRDTDPIAGPHTFEATIEFVTWDGRKGVHVVFGGQDAGRVGSARCRIVGSKRGQDERSCGTSLARTL